MVIVETFFDFVDYLHGRAWCHVEFWGWGVDGFHDEVGKRGGRVGLLEGDDTLVDFEEHFFFSWSHGVEDRLAFHECRDDYQRTLFGDPET